jgi:hypothetical protein
MNTYLQAAPLDALLIEFYSTDCVNTESLLWNMLHVRKKSEKQTCDNRATAGPPSKWAEAITPAIFCAS